MAFTVFIRGIPEKPDVKDVRVFPTADFDAQALFRIPVNVTAQACDQIVVDPKGKHFQGQVYKWFHLLFSEGRQGWVRDDLLDVQGDLTSFGYRIYSSRTFAFVAGAGIVPTTVAIVTPTSTEVKRITQESTVIIVPFGTSPDGKTSTNPASTKPIIQTTTQTTTQSTTPPVGTPTSTATPAANATTKVATTPPTASCAATIRGDVQARVRELPSINGAALGTIDANRSIVITGVAAGQDGQGYRWVKASGIDLTSVPITGYIREDLIVPTADCNIFGLATAVVLNPANPDDTSRTNRFPSPIKAEAYSITQEFGNQGHKGTDLGARVGVPVMASGVGIVTKVVRCTRCTEAQPNFASQGIPDWSSDAVKDPAWGYGFGNYIIVRYAWADMPNLMRTAMTAMNLVNGYAYVIHAHLSRIDTQPSTAVKAGDLLGAVGNTGNSTGPHLHLEIKVSMSANETDLYNRVPINARNLYLLK